MSVLSCENRLVLDPKKPDISVRCRRCQPCLKARQFEWKNRMFLESWGRNTRPLFLTWTFRPENYLESEIYVLRETQKLYRRLRRRKHDIRYFSSIERGTRNGRLHSHSIVWSESLSRLPWADLFWTLHGAWGNGGIKLRQVRSPGAFHYVAKYIIKDCLPVVDPSTGEYRTSRNYTWSNRPRLGNPGLLRWEYLVRKMAEPGILPNWFNGPLFGKIERFYVPSGPWNRTRKALIRDKEVTNIDISELVPDQAVMYEPDIPVIEWVDKHVQVLR